jgi:hypothetical protein
MGFLVFMYPLIVLFVLASNDPSFGDVMREILVLKIAIFL